MYDKNKKVDRMYFVVVKEALCTVQKAIFLHTFFKISKVKGMLL